LHYKIGGKRKRGTDKNPSPLRPCDVQKFKFMKFMITFVGLAYQGKDIVFRFIIEYSSLRDFGPY
jgi:hypothetical protein